MLLLFSYEAVPRAVTRPSKGSLKEFMFEDIGTLHDLYQEFGIYPLLTLLASFA